MAGPSPTLTADRREDVLAYLQALLGTVSGIKACHRDRDGLPDKTNLPAIFLLDGKETLVTEIRSGRTAGVSDTRMLPAVFQLEPQVFLQLVPRDDDTNLTVGGIAAPVGPELSAYRVAVIKLLTQDTNLWAMLGSNGTVRYLGCETDMQAMAPLVGQLRLDFQFHYVVDPNKL